MTLSTSFIEICINNDAIKGRNGLYGSLASLAYGSLAYGIRGDLNLHSVARESQLI